MATDGLIEQLCQRLGEKLQTAPTSGLNDLIAYLQRVIEADANLKRALTDKAVQINQGDATGYQVLVEGGQAYIGTHLRVTDPSLVEVALNTILAAYLSRPVGTPSNLPFSGVVKFVGREEALALVQSKLQATTTVAITSVSGMGGVGKTELALQYAYQHLQANTYPGGLCWINVRAQDVGLGLLEFARTQLGLPEPPDILETLLEKLQWVCRRWQGEPILVVLDDVTDYEAVQPYLDLLDPRFRVLMTTRLKLRAKAEQLELEVLTEAAALELLRVLVDDPHRIDSQLTDAQRLCEWLGYLPLGLELVGRYLTEDEDISFEEMLDLLLQERLAAEALLEAYPEMTASLGVATAFELSWKELTDEAKKLSCLLSIFALAPVPWNLVEQCLPDWEKRQLKQCRDRQLKKRSLLSRVGQEFYQLHQLIREFFAAKQEQMAGTDEMKKSFCQVMVQEADAIPQVTPTLAQIQQATPVIPHLAEALTNLTNWLANTDLVLSFVKIARFYAAQGTYAQAVSWLEQCCVVAETRLGNNHPDVALALNGLASFYHTQGRYNEAEPLHKRALSIQEQQLDSNDPNTAVGLSNLGALYQARGRYAEAEPLLLRSLAILEQQLGKDNLGNVKPLNNLASLYQSQGRYAEAEPFYQRSISIREQQLGKDHPDLTHALNNLASLYQIQERYSEAEPLLQRAIAIGEEHLGSDHPNLSLYLSNLANVYREQRKGMTNPLQEPGNFTSEAEPLYQRALTITEQQLGSDHPNVATILSNLAELYREQRRYGEAEPLYQKALVILEQQLGCDHPDVARNLNNLAEVYREQGRYEDAEPLYGRAWLILKEVLSENNSLTQIVEENWRVSVLKTAREGQVEELSDHPRVARWLNALANGYQEQGSYSEAEQLYKKALSIREQQLGSDHLDVSESLSGLALLYQVQGRYIDAELLYQRSLLIVEKQSGANHPRSTTSLKNLAKLYQEQGRYAEAEPLFLQVLSIRKKQVMRDNCPPLTNYHNNVAYADSFNDLGLLYQAQGRYDEAEPLYKQSLAIWEQQLGKYQRTDRPPLGYHHDNLAYADSLNNLAELYRTQGRYSEAEHLYERSLAIWEQQLGKDHPNVANSLNNLGLLYQAQGRYAEAESVYRRAWSISMNVLGENNRLTQIVWGNLQLLVQQAVNVGRAEDLSDHPHIATQLNNLAEAYDKQGRYSEAESLYLRVIQIRKTQLGADHLDTAASLDNLAFLYYSQERYAEAEPLLQQILQIRETQLGAAHPDTADTRLGMASLYYEQGRYSEAELLYQSLLSTQEQLGNEHPTVVRCLNDLASLYQNQERYSEAEPLYLKVIEIRKTQLGADHLDTATSLNNLALLYLSQERYAEIEPLLQQVLQIRETQLGADHPDTADARQGLEWVRQTLDHS
jgi:tetratricopeptide (TPR) repeat protein